MTKKSLRFRVGLTLLAVVAVTIGIAATKNHTFTARDKAFYADARTISFVRPGLDLKIASAEVAADGTIRATVRIADPKGVPLDREGIVSPGSVAMSFIAAYIPQGQTQYVSYTTRTQVSNITSNSAIQAAADTGGIFTKTADGEYVYTFRTKAPAGFDANATHTIGVYSSRVLTEFELGTNFASATYNFVPGGGKVSEVRDVIKSATCNKCHGEINAHGGARRGIEMCVLCHTPQTVDPDTGNTVDLAVMAHKIHAGSKLPSVQDGGKYQIIGFNNTVVDYSKVGFPPDIRNCEVCHVQKGPDAASQADRVNAANRAACGSCHDNINFAKGDIHIPQVDDASCTTCHYPEGVREFDTSIKGAHTIPEKSTQLPGTVFSLVDVKDFVAGKSPTVTFTVKDNKGNPVKPSALTALSLVLGGPTTDYTNYWSESALAAPSTADGRATYTFTRALPADAKGSYTLSMEGYRTITIRSFGNLPVTVRDPGKNFVKTFSIDNSPVAQRRQVVSLAKCNNCHSSLSLHGGNRNQIEACVICHNPANTDALRRPAAQAPNESVHFGTMVHRIHAGNKQIRNYTIFGFGGSVNNFNNVGFPNELNNCAACHVNGSEQLPLAATLSDVQDPRSFVPLAGPATAVCSGCHVSKDAATHFIRNSSSLGESCTVCHGPAADQAVSKVHAK